MTKSSSPSRLDAFFGNPAAAVGMAVVCNVLWGSAFPFIKMGYRLFAIDATDTASIMCFAGVRFMLSALLVYAGGAALRRGPLPMPKGKNLLSCCGLGLWQTAAQYTFYYSAVALLTGAMGGILNSTQSFMGVILAHFLYGKADRMTPRKAIGCALGFSGVLVATLGNHGSGSPAGVAYMLIASVIFALAGAVEQSRDPKGGFVHRLLPEPWGRRCGAAGHRPCSGRQPAPAKLWRCARCCFSWHLSPVPVM